MARFILITYSSRECIPPSMSGFSVLKMVKVGDFQLMPGPWKDRCLEFQFTLFSISPFFMLKLLCYGRRSWAQRCSRREHHSY